MKQPVFLIFKDVLLSLMPILLRLSEPQICLLLSDWQRLLIRDGTEPLLACGSSILLTLLTPLGA